MTVFIRSILLFLLFFGSFAPVQALRAETRTEGIAAVVGQDAITVSDVSARIRLVIVSSGMPDNQEIRNRLAPQIINVLVEEQIKIQEAERLGINISPEDVEQGFAVIAGQNNFTKEQFISILNKEKIPYRTMQNQIKAQIAWSRVVQNELQPQIIVTETEVQNMFDHMMSNEGEIEYLVSEIFLPVEKVTEEANIKALADRLVGQLIKQESPFSRVAAQFSQSAAAARGGDLGWVQEGQLQDKIKEQIERMEVGDLSKPVRSLSGYHILLLRDKRQISSETIPTFEQIGSQIGMDQLERLARRYLIDLKATAFIEYRV
jgi:peptidyl-prolyl cis-trans isomerase SurA